MDGNSIFPYRSAFVLLTSFLSLFQLLEDIHIRSKKIGSVVKWKNMSKQLKPIPQFY